MTTNGHKVNWERVPEQGDSPKDPLWFLKDTAKGMKDDYHQMVARAMEKSQAIREAEVKFGTPGMAGIAVRREGITRRVNPEDRERENALKANRDRKVLSAHDLNDLGGLAVTGQKFVLDVAEELSDHTDNLPAHLQPLGEALTQVSVQVLSAKYIEQLKFNAEMGNRQIAQATTPKQPQQ
jgi:hypothetical protein